MIDYFSLRSDRILLPNLSYDRTVWFDHPEKAKATGVPEGKLFELFLRLEGPLAIGERLYAKSGNVKCMKIRDYRITDWTDDDFMKDVIRLASEYGLKTFFRESKRPIHENDGRYYSDVHDPTWRPEPWNPPPKVV